MTHYRERLWPSFGIFLASALVIPAGLLVFLPINLIAGIVVALALYAGIVAALIYSTPTVAVTDTHLVAGRARLPLGMIGAVSVHRGDDARLERGPRLDARAWLVIRGWVDPVVRIELTDPDDPTPYWILSSRRPDQFVQAIETVRPRTPGRSVRASTRGGSASGASRGSTPRT